MDGNVHIFDWYWDMPVVTRGYFTACSIATIACALDIITPFHLYYNSHAIWVGGQYWRLVTNFLFFGSWGIDFLFHMYFLIRYCRSLEEGSKFRGHPFDFLFCLVFCMFCIMSVAPYTNMMFFGSSLTFMLVYLWGKRNPEMQISLLGLIGFTAPYLPWVLLAFTVLLGHDITSDALGIIVGHLYYYLDDVYPALALVRQWTIKKILPTPSNIYSLSKLIYQQIQYRLGWPMDGNHPQAGGFNVVQAPVLLQPVPLQQQQQQQPPPLVHPHQD